MISSDGPNTGDGIGDQRREPPECWGVSSCIDLYECDLGLIQDADVIRTFTASLCERIRMKRYGDTQVVHFGKDPRVKGFSMTQLIETSLISAHFAEASRAIYLDIFSCAPYDPKDAAEFALEYFKAARYNLSVIERKLFPHRTEPRLLFSPGKSNA